MSESSRSGEVLLAFLIGGLVGVAAGIIFAPRSGKETRKRIATLAEDLTEEVKEATGDIKVKAENFVAQTKVKAEDIASKAKSKVQELVDDVKDNLAH